MSSGTKVFLAIFAIIIGILVFYYGILMPAAPPKQKLEKENTTAAPPSVETPENEPNQTPLWQSSEPEPGFLSDSLQEALALETPNDNAATFWRTTPYVPAAVKPNVVKTERDSFIDERPMEQPMVEYVIKSGDTFSSIAEDWYGESDKWMVVAKANPFIDPARMQIGQKLKLPSKQSSTQLIKEQFEDDQNVHVVRPGETLSSIAENKLGDSAKWHELFDANRKVIGASPDRLKVGMKLVIPAQN